MIQPKFIQLTKYLSLNNSIYNNEELISLSKVNNKENIDDMLINYDKLKNLYEDDFQIIKYIYSNEKSINKILYNKEEIIKLNSIIKKDYLSYLFYLVLLIRDQTIINYIYSFEFIQKMNELHINNDNNLYYKIILSKIILKLIENFKNSDEYEEENELYLDKITKENSIIINNKIDIFKELNLNWTEKDFIILLNIDEIYINIIIALISKKNFENLEYILNILNQLKIKNIDLNKTMFDKLNNFFKDNENIKKEYRIIKLEDLFIEKKINFYFVLFKYILKNSIFIFQINFLLQSKKNIIKLVKYNINENKSFFIKEKIDNNMIERMKYILDIFFDSKYYNEKYINKFFENLNENIINEESQSSNKEETNIINNQDESANKEESNIIDFQEFINKKGSIIINNQDESTNKQEGIIFNNQDALTNKDESIITNNQKELTKKEENNIINNQEESTDKDDCNIINKQENSNNSSEGNSFEIIKNNENNSEDNSSSGLKNINEHTNLFSNERNSLFEQINKYTNKPNNNISNIGINNKEKYYIIKYIQNIITKNEEIKNSIPYTIDCIKEINNMFFCYGGMNGLRIINERYQELNKPKDIKNWINCIFKINNINDNEIIICDKENIYVYNLVNNEFKIRECCNINLKGSMLFLIDTKYNKEKLYCCSENELNILINFSSKIYKEEIENVYENCFYKSCIKLYNFIFIFKSNRIAHKGNDKLLFFNFFSQTEIKNNIKEKYSFIFSSNGILVLPPNNINKEYKHKLVLFACKKYLKKQKNGILLINIENIYNNNNDNSCIPDFINEININMNHYFYDTGNFEVYCFCPILSIEKKIFENGRKMKDTGYFLVGGFDLKRKKGMIKLFKVNYGEKYYETNIEYIEDIIFENENNFKGFKKPISCITQSSKEEKLLISCWDGNIYSFNISNNKYFNKQNNQINKKVSFKEFFELK